MFIVIVIVFSVCLLLYVIFVLVLEFMGVDWNYFVRVGLVVVLLLFYVNSVINLLILCIMSKDYRKGFWFCGC